MTTSYEVAKVCLSRCGCAPTPPGATILTRPSFASTPPFCAESKVVTRARLRRIPTVTRQPKIGVLAVQGNFREHVAMLRRLGADAVEVRLPEQLAGLDGLIIPGGESTAFTRLMGLYGLDEALREFDRPVFGTCAGMIVLDRNHLGLVDVEV